MHVRQGAYTIMELDLRRAVNGFVIAAGACTHHTSYLLLNGSGLVKCSTCDA